MAAIVVAGEAPEHAGMRRDAQKYRRLGHYVRLER